MSLNRGNMLVGSNSPKLARADINDMFADLGYGASGSVSPITTTGEANKLFKFSAIANTILHFLRIRKSSTTAFNVQDDSSVDVLNVDTANKIVTSYNQKISGLAGTGNRMVVTDSTGILSASLQVETGYWTPVLQGGASGVAVAGVLNKGEYTKIGKLVMFSAHVEWTSITGTITGNRVIAGLPYACGPFTRGSAAIGTSTGGSIVCGANRTLRVLTETNSNYLYLAETDLQNGGSYVNTVTIGSSGALYSISGCYHTN